MKGGFARSVFSLIAATALASAASAATRTVVDARGRPVSFDAPVRRLVFVRSLLVTDLALLLGRDLDGLVVGWDRSLATSYRDLYAHLVGACPRLAQAAELGDVLREGISVEKVVALKPDLVVMHTQIGRRAPAVARALEATGLPVLYLADDEPYRAPLRNMRILGRVFGREARAEELCAFVSNEQQRVFSRLARVPDAERPRVYFEVGGVGPSRYGNAYGRAGRGRTFSWGHVLDAVKCRNVTEGSVAAMAPSTPEFVVASDPEFVFIAGSDFAMPDSFRLGYATEAATAAATLRRYAARPGWAQIEAVREKRVFGVHMRFCEGLLTCVGTQFLAKRLHPRECGDLEPEKTLAEIHRRFLPWPLTGCWMTEGVP